jgi:hypothetical protein
MIGTLRRGVDNPNEGAILGEQEELMMDCYLYKEERLVYESEGWGIIVDDIDIIGGHRTFSEGEQSVYATHAKCTVSYDSEHDPERKHEGVTYGECCWDVDTEPRCTVCKEQVPVSIQTLVALQSWEK